MIVRQVFNCLSIAKKGGNECQKYLDWLQCNIGDRRVQLLLVGEKDIFVDEHFYSHELYGYNKHTHCKVMLSLTNFGTWRHTFCRCLKCKR